MSVPKEHVVRMYSDMVTIRLYEEEMVAAYQEGKHPVFNIAAGPVPGEMHLAAGQEPVAAGVCIHLRQDDAVVGTHRPHHFAIAKGVDLNKMTAEIFGRATGLGRGKGGHMHLFDAEAHFGCSGIVGASPPPAVGSALAFKMRGEDRVAVAFFGEGAANQGTFHEALNLAALWKSPVVFVCEDNDWGISVHKRKSTSIARNADRAVAYGMPGVYVDDNDVLAVYQHAGEAVARARRGEGPTLIEVKTYRLLGHFEGDPQMYRQEDEVPNLRANDPINRFRKHLLQNGIVDEAEIGRLDEAARKRVEDAFKFAKDSPYPNPEEALLHVFAV